MEDALRATLTPGTKTKLVVLILVLMEDALRGDRAKYCSECKKAVLILVLMEDALRVYNFNYFDMCRNCLNPCSNGRCSARSDGTQAFFMLHKS